MWTGSHREDSQIAKGQSGGQFIVSEQVATSGQPSINGKAASVDTGSYHVDRGPYLTQGQTTSLAGSYHGDQQHSQDKQSNV